MFMLIKRYIDNFLIVIGEKYLNEFFGQLNKVHSNPSNKRQRGNDDCLAFLDSLLIRRPNGRFIAWRVQRIQFPSFGTVAYKKGLVKSLQSPKYLQHTPGAKGGRVLKWGCPGKPDEFIDAYKRKRSEVTLRGRCGS